MQTPIIEPDSTKLQLLNNLPAGLGLQPILIKEIYKALHYYSMALGGHKIGLSILRVNPLVSYLHSYALGGLSSESGQAYTFKPKYTQTKTLRTSILAGFLGKASKDYLAYLNEQYDAEVKEHFPSQPSSLDVSKSSATPYTDQQMMYSRRRSLPAVQQKMVRKSSSAYRLSDVISSADTDMVFKNLNLRFPLSHFLHLYRNKIIELIDIKIDHGSLVIVFNECINHGYDNNANIIAHRPIKNGIAKLTLSETNMFSVNRLLSSNFHSSEDKGSCFFSAAIDVNELVSIHFSDHTPVVTIGVSTYNNDINIDDALIIADLDAHMVILSEEISHGKTLSADPRARKNILKDPENKPIKDTVTKLLSSYMHSGLEDFKNFDWASFARQIELGGDFGSISTQELVLFTFINHFCGRGLFGTISRLMQHGPTNRYVKQINNDRLEVDSITQQPKFPAVNESVEVGVIYSTGEFHHKSGTALLTYYRDLESQFCNVFLHPVWQAQIELLNKALTQHHPETVEILTKVSLVCQPPVIREGHYLKSPEDVKDNEPNSVECCAIL